MLTGSERMLMKHALGLTQADKPYRNRFFTATDSAAARTWSLLVEGGMAVAVKAYDTRKVCFCVTDRGMQALGVSPLDGLEPSERYP